MARQNLVMIYGRVATAPRIVKQNETNEYVIAIARIETVRGKRSTHEGVVRRKNNDTLILITREPEQCAEIETWQENDVVLAKGMLASAETARKSFCPYCKSKNVDGEETATETITRGLDIYVNLIEGTKIKSFPDKESAMKDVMNCKELSNQLYITGSVRTKPKIFYTKKHTMITQYQLDISRKFKVRLDDPGKREDMPWVKSYGEIAFEDNLRIIQAKTEVQIEGYIQARNVKRTTKCPVCGKFHTFMDEVMEIVPYSVDYLREYKTDAMLEAEKQEDIETIKQNIFDNIEQREEDDFSNDPAVL